MRRAHTYLALVFLAAAVSQPHAEPKAKPVTKADLERIEKRLDEQQKQLDKLVKAHVQYLQSIKGMVDGPVAGKDEPKPDDAKPPEPRPVVDDPKPAAEKPKAPPPARKVEVKKAAVKKAEGTGTIVGKITGAGDAIVYLDDIVATSRGSATMKQEGKQFVPNVLVVQKGTTVAFPNRDAIFHNVFSVTPDHSFDLGSYAQGDTKSVTMSKPGVVSVYCNMHPQMVGHILVVPNGNYARVGKDGFYRLTNIPAGRHRVVAWAPNAKPVSADAEVGDNGVVTIELELKKGRTAAHTKKDGLPYGSYD